VYFKIGKTSDDKDVAIVIGWDDACGLDEDMEANYIENHYILPAKVAYNCDNHRGGVIGPNNIFNSKRSKGVLA
jgi:hypothetical protein